MFLEEMVVDQPMEFVSGDVIQDLGEIIICLVLQKIIKTFFFAQYVVDKLDDQSSAVTFLQDGTSEDEAFTVSEMCEYFCF